MSKLTEVLKLLCYDPETDGNLTFNVTEALTKNWEKIDQLVLLAVAAAAAYDPEGSYAVGAYCTHGGKLHKCNTPISGGEAWNAEHWTETTVAAELAEVRASLSNKLPAPMEISPDTALNNVTSPGLYFCGAGLTVSNAPPNPMSETAFSLLVERTHATGIKQTLSWYYTGSSYYRTFDGESWHDWALNATAIPPQKQNISLLNGVQPTDSGCVFWKQQDNVCTVAIACTKPTDGLTPDMIIGTLPVGFRPSYIERAGYADTSSAQTFSAVLRIYEDGNIQIWFPNTSANVFVAEASFPVRDNGGTE